MSYPRYPEYKDSGVEWFGEVPAHWRLMPFKRDIDFITSGARGWAANYSEEGDLFIRIGNLTRDSIRLDLSDIQRVVVPEGAEVNRTKVQLGDILFSITAYLGSVAVVSEGVGRAFVSQHVALVRPSNKYCLPRWAAYVAISYIGKVHFETTGYGGTKIQLSLDDVTSLPMIVPPLGEQAILLDLIDREVSKTDALVAEQEKLMALLKEKRQAVISHAVTKGLDPAVPMKDSGVEWLGEVPAHWEVARLATIFREVINAGNDSLPILSVSIHDGVSDKELNDTEMDRKVTRSEDRSKYKAVRPGDLAYNMMRAWQGGFGAVLVDGQVSPAYVVARPQRDVRTDFVELLLRTPQAVEQMRRYSRGITDFRLRLYWEEFKNMRIALPPLEEQDQILAEISGVTNTFDTLTNEARLVISLLQERRAALISAAVTGKIDVRGTEKALAA